MTKQEIQEKIYDASKNNKQDIRVLRNIALMDRELQAELGRLEPTKLEATSAEALEALHALALESTKALYEIARIDPEITRRVSRGVDAWPTLIEIIPSLTVKGFEKTSHERERGGVAPFTPDANMTESLLSVLEMGPALKLKPANVKSGKPPYSLTSPSVRLVYRAMGLLLSWAEPDDPDEAEWIKNTPNLAAPPDPFIKELRKLPKFNKNTSAAWTDHLLSYMRWREGPTNSDDELHYNAEAPEYVRILLSPSAISDTIKHPTERIRQVKKRLAEIAKNIAPDS